MGKPRRRGNGLWLRGKTWMLDIRHQGKRYVMKIGHNINRSTAQEIAAIKRAEILKGEVGLTKKPEPLTFDQAAKLAQLALELAQEARQFRRARDIQSRLTGYRRQLPHRQRRP